MPVVTDQQNPGRRQTQRFSVAGGLNGNKGDQETKGVEFLLLKNCLPDKRLNALVKRPGSVVESITASQPIALGINEYVAASSSPTIPVYRALLANFGGQNFWNQIGTEWSTVPVNSRCNFGHSRVTSFSKLGVSMYIAGGRPARWSGPGTEIDRIGIIPPASAITIASVATAGSITLTSGAIYMYTYYNSSFAYESDWSPLSVSTGAITSKQIAITIPSTVTPWTLNFDKIRIYRCFDGGTAPYLVATVPSDTTSYTDTLTDAQLTTRAPTHYDNAIPPDETYLCNKFANCIWFVDASNPYKLVFSKPYIGSENDLQYYPADNFVFANEPITGLLVIPGKMLVFHPRSISYISGFTADDFQFMPFIPGVGTVFPNSIATNGTDIIFLAEQGWVTIGVGQPPRHISRPVDHDLQPLLAGSYNSSIFASAAWNPSLRQFICLVTCNSTAGAAWEEVGTGSTTSATSGWQTVSLVDDTWEDVSNPSASASTRVKIWGWSPELDIWTEYTFPVITDDNGSAAYPVCLYHPQPSSATADPQQDKTYLGYWDGTQGKIRSCFRRDTNTDSGSAITAEWLTGRIAPGDGDGGYKYFHNLGFDNSYSDPTSDGLCTLKYLLDFDDPHLRSYAASLITFIGSTDLKVFPTAVGRHIHLYGTDTSLSQSKVLLSEFFVHYRERFTRDGR